jgi:acyl-ACP thioesterase
MDKCHLGWVLNKFALVVYEYPLLRENITIKTWSRGLKSFKAFRDFEVYKDGKMIAHATSFWFCVDTKRKRVIKIPDEVQKMYGYHDITTGVEIDDSEPEELEGSYIEKQHTIRYSDIDENGHLNNVVYLDLIEDTLFANNDLRKISQYYSSFKKEIPYSMESIIVSALKADDKRYFFNFNKSQEIYCEGVISLS